jgi:hypothetical protein
MQIQAQEIHVGNIVWLRENEEVPCDLVIIGTSDPQGICCVEVKQFQQTFFAFSLIFISVISLLIFITWCSLL